MKYICIESYKDHRKGEIIEAEDGYPYSKYWKKLIDRYLNDKILLEKNRVFEEEDRLQEIVSNIGTLDIIFRPNDVKRKRKEYEEIKRKSWKLLNPNTVYGIVDDRKNKVTHDMNEIQESPIVYYSEL